jgi:hypothetical protein
MEYMSIKFDFDFMNTNLGMVCYFLEGFSTKANNNKGVNYNTYLHISIAFCYI